MREIKFRGKDNNGNWRYGDLLQEPNTCKDIYWIIEKGTTSYKSKEEDINKFIKEAYNEVNKETIGQFTGLYDKNGKEIYEGDITDDGYNNRGVVKYGKYNCSCCKGVYGWYVEGGDIRCAESFLTVIGNIYENPELLKGADNIE